MTYGYSPNVGDWFGSVELPEDRRTITAVRLALGLLRPVLEARHRPSEIRISWAEMDANGNELAYHELEQHAVETWADILAEIERLEARVLQIVIECLFVELATRVIEPSGEVWKPSAAVLQLGIDLPDPSTIEVHYTTHLDAWLSTTYDEHYQPRDNYLIARTNRPALEAVIDKLRELTGSTFRIGRSRLYPFAITERGFRDEDDLPPRGRGTSS